ncbi:MAG: AAA family ATPase [Candidatus Gastranaerophilales bacterium]|nr:AAA family ATPase [Candidatus Gastranaerophilales bacterium]
MKRVRITKKQLESMLQKATEEQAIEAVKILKKESYSSRRKSDYYFVVYENAYYPLKETIRVLNDKVLNNKIKLGDTKNYNFYPFEALEVWKKLFADFKSIKAINAKDENKKQDNLNNHQGDEGEKMNNKQVLNQILYGPPGTGKTYHLKDYIDEIIGKNPGLKSFDEAQKINEIVKNLYWYQTIALIMYLNDRKAKYKVKTIENHPIMRQYAPLKNSKNVYLTIITQLQIHTDINSSTVNYGAKTSPAIFNKTNDSEWYLTEDGIKYVEENLSQQLEQLNSKDNIRNKKDFYKFITFHQSYSYEEFVEGIKPCIKDDEEINSTISYEFAKGVFKEICQQANSDPKNKYLLIIDEINRGNISKIFGELITLIEEDKRVVPNGEWNFENTEIKEQQLLVTLPYTKKPFGVPKNLYIIGTMNTSDRSIASIDIALRRRFKFKEMMPQANLVANFGCDFRETFKALNKRIEILLDRDHQIGHSYFIEEKYKDSGISELKEIWYDSIIPLLNEYFYGDWEKLKLIVPDFIGESTIPKELRNECDQEKYYYFEEFSNTNDFKNALNSIRFKKEENAQ